MDQAQCPAVERIPRRYSAKKADLQAVNMRGDGATSHRRHKNFKKSCRPLYHSINILVK